MPSLMTVHRNGRSLEIHFHDPSSKNALSLKAARELRTILKAGDFDSLIFSSGGRVFCSGGHLTDYAQMSEADQGRAVNDEIRAILDELSKLDKPTIACVSGDAFGGGVELLSAFDVVIAAPHVMLALWQRKIGLSFGWGGGSRIENRIGASELKRLSLTTHALTAHEALKSGLIDLVVQESEMKTAARDLAAKLSSLPSEPISTLKNFEASSEAKAFNAIWWNPSHRATLAKRKRQN